MATKTEYKILVTTGDFKFAGTDADVSITLIDVKGLRSGPHELDKFLRNDFERGCTDEFKLKIKENLSDLAEIELNFSGSDWWYCQHVDVYQVQLCKAYIFPVHRWLKKRMNLKVALYDCDLPQNSLHKEQRRQELEEKKRIYEYKENYPGLPVQVKNMPRDESFSDDIKWDIMKRKFTLISEKIWAIIFNGKQEFKSLDEIRELFDEFPSLEPPIGTENWKEDSFFGDRRLNGCNPKALKLCTVIPNNFAVEADRVEPFLEGATLQSALSSKRIFIVDLKILEGIKTVNQAVLCTPLALFYHTNDHQLIPIAIQLLQTGEDNPVFYPSDEENLWLLVKMWYNNADATFHQSCVHLGCTHLVMEGIYVSLHRTLSPSHPIHKLLAPHFLYIVAINTLGLEKLISPGGWVDNTMTVGRDGMLQLMAKRHSQFSITKHADFKQDLKERGLFEDLLPHYYYRKDGLRIYDAIGTYVEKLIRLFYATEKDIQNDYELQDWAREMSGSREIDGGEIRGLGLQDVPGNGKFDNFDDLIAFIRLVVFICSCEHAAANFNQYDNYAFTPIYPAYLYGQPPSDKQPRTEADLLKSLPNKSQTMDTMVITKILSTRSTQALGDFEVTYQFRPEALAVVHEFKKKLEDISQDIQHELPQRTTPYSLLDPITIPNSISI